MNFNSKANWFNADKGGSNHVVDNLRSSFDPLAIGFGIQLHDGWIHSLAFGTRTGSSGN
jgi:hypothetical protein